MRLPGLPAKTRPRRTGVRGRLRVGELRCALSAEDLEARVNLTRLRREMRARFLASPLCDSAGFASAMEEVYRHRRESGRALPRKGQPVRLTEFESNPVQLLKRFQVRWFVERPKVSRLAA